MQGQSTEFEVIPFTVAALGVIPGVLCLIPQRAEFIPHLSYQLALKEFIEHLTHQPALKIATIVAALFRPLDAICICCNTTGDAVNYFRSRLQESFL
uniref:Uncharacterized protein n=1 Tax=Arundo donax TaxID=35708 RepID=A0A0A8ZM29_ARUDO